MSAFSEYLTIIKNKRNLNSAAIADICGIDTTVVFRWMKGERIPDDISRLRKLELRLRLSEHEKRELEDAYVITVYGKEKYRNFKDIIRIINELRRCRDEHEMPEEWDEIISNEINQNNIQNMCDSSKSNNNKMINSSNKHSAKKFKYFNNKSSIIHGIEQVLTKLSRSEGKQLYVVNSSINEEVAIILRIFCNVINCNTEHIICLQDVEKKSGKNIRNLRKLLEIIEVVFRKNKINMYLANSDVMGNINWILSEYFYLQYNNSMTEGFMTTYQEWIDMQKEVFDYIKSESSAVDKNEEDDLEHTDYKYENQYPENAVIRYIGEQPCFHYLMNRDTCQSKEIKTFFSEWGLEEFIRGSAAKNENLYNESCSKMSIEERCKMVKELAALSQAGINENYMISDSRLSDLKNIHIEYIKGDVFSDVRISVNYADGQKDKIVLNDKEILCGFEDFFECMENKRYVYSLEKTKEKMLQIVEKYEKMESEQ